MAYSTALAEPIRETKRPRYSRNMVWTASSAFLTPSSSATLFLPPLPCPPAPDDPAFAATRATIKAHPDLFKIVTPIKVDRFVRLLSRHPNRALIASVERGFREGFWPMLELGDSEWFTRPFPERESAPEERDFLIAQVKKEEALGRLSRVFSRSDEPLWPGMGEVPVHAVPKPDSDDFRMVIDQSAGPGAPNDYISREAINIKLDNVQHLGHNILATRRRGRTPRFLFKDDVAGAYRIGPLHPLFQARQVITVNGERRVDRCNNFGNRAAGYLFCVIMGLILWIAEHEWGIEGLLAYVDDVFGVEDEDEMEFYAPYGKYLPRKQARLLGLWDWIGVPHEHRKQLFGRALKIIGFTVSLDDLSISIDENARRRHATAIRQFVTNRKQPLVEWQRVLGWANWFLNVDPLLRPALQSSYQKVRGKKARNAPVFLNLVVRKDLEWFADRVMRSRGVFLMEVSDWGIAEADLRIWTDASGVGMGIWCGEDNVGLQAERFSFPAAAGEIFYFEALTVVSALEYACARSPRPKRLVIFCDNTNAVNLFDKLKADSPYNDILFYSIQLRQEYEIDLRVVWIRSEENPIADAISRFDLGTVHRYAPNARIIPFQPPRLPLGAPKL